MPSKTKILTDAKLITPPRLLKYGVRCECALALLVYNSI